MTHFKNNSGSKVIYVLKLTCIMFMLEVQLKMNSVTKFLLFEPKR